MLNTPETKSVDRSERVSNIYSKLTQAAASISLAASESNKSADPNAIATPSANVTLKSRGDNMSMSTHGRRRMQRTSRSVSPPRVSFNLEHSDSRSDDDDEDILDSKSKPRRRDSKQLSNKSTALVTDSSDSYASSRSSSVDSSERKDNSINNIANRVREMTVERALVRARRRQKLSTSQNKNRTNDNNRSSSSSRSRSGGRTKKQDVSEGVESSAIMSHQMFHDYFNLNRQSPNVHLTESRSQKENQSRRDRWLQLGLQNRLPQNLSESWLPPRYSTLEFFVHKHLRSNNIY
jgi:hypothetical protein